MCIVDVIRRLAKEKGMSITTLERTIGLGNGTIGKWNKQSPSCDKLKLVADYLSTTIDYIITGEEKSPSLPKDELELLTYYRQLPEREQIKLIGRVAGIAELLAEQAQEQPEPEDIKPPTIRMYCSDNRVSAGLGDELYDYEQWDTVDIAETAQSRKADFMLIVDGDSMEPTFHNGDYILVRQQPAVELGQIGIFNVNGKGYVKKYEGDRLVSLNSKYSDIDIKDENIELRCFGLVLGTAEIID